MMIVFLLLIPVILILAQDDLSSCPLNLIRNNALIAHNGYCYEFVISHNFDWQHAHGDCTSKGGHLVVVRSSTDNLFIMSSLRSLNFHGDTVWIGLSDQKIEGSYEWSTGEAVTYTNWASGQPDLQATIEDCVILKYSDGGHWHDYACFNFIFHQNNYPWICEYKQASTYKTTTHASTTKTTTQASTTKTTTQASTTKTTAQASTTKTTTQASTTKTTAQASTTKTTTQASTTKTTTQASTTKTTTQASTTKTTAQASTTKTTTQASTTKTATLTTTSNSATTAMHLVTTGKCVNSPFVNCDTSNICSTSAWAHYCPVTCGKCRKTLSTRKITSGTTEGWFVIGQKPTAHWFLIPTRNN